MPSVTTFLILSSLILVVSGWGDVIHYPEFVKYIGEIGKYKEDPVQDELGYITDRKRALFSSIMGLRRALDDAGMWRMEDNELERMRRGRIKKRSFSTSQLRRQ